MNRVKHENAVVVEIESGKLVSDKFVSDKLSMVRWRNKKIIWVS